jgi:LPS export ABC transporter protein LptC
MDKKTVILTIVVTLLLFVFAGCSLNYGDTTMADDISEQIPETILYDFTHTIVKDSKPLFRIQAKKAETYTKRKETILYNIRFVEYAENGDIITEGTADKATFYNDSENAELVGDIDFYSSTEDGGLSGDYLYWDKQSRSLTGTSEKQIRIYRDSGSQVTGDDFDVDFKHRTITYRQAVKGVHIVKEE